VASFTGEKQAVERYKLSLRNAYKSGVQEGLMAGLGRGSVMLSLFVAQAFGTWYGSKLILRHGYTGAQVVNILFAIVRCCR
jgi:ATP-binding cassette, subfamily B (MDR/TAP), member 1